MKIFLTEAYGSGESETLIKYVPEFNNSDAKNQNVFYLKEFYRCSVMFDHCSLDSGSPSSHLDFVIICTVKPC